MLCILSDIFVLKKRGGVITDNVCKWRKFLAKVFTIPLLNPYSDVYLQI